MKSSSCLCSVSSSAKKTAKEVVEDDLVEEDVVEEKWVEEDVEEEDVHEEEVKEEVVDNSEVKMVVKEAIGSFKKSWHLC